MLCANTFTETTDILKIFYQNKNKFDDRRIFHKFLKHSKGHQWAYSLIFLSVHPFCKGVELRLF